MTNEIDLHSTNNVPKSGLSRVLVYYYFVLVTLVPIILVSISFPVWKLVAIVLVVVFAMAPPLIKLRNVRRLHRLRQAQVAELRKDTK